MGGRSRTRDFSEITVRDLPPSRQGGRSRTRGFTGTTVRDLPPSPGVTESQEFPAFSAGVPGVTEGQESLEPVGVENRAHFCFA